MIVFDEPTSGLDAIAAARLSALARRLCRERELAMLWITHDVLTLAGKREDQALGGE